MNEPQSTDTKDQEAIDQQAAERAEQEQPQDESNTVESVQPANDKVDHEALDAESDAESEPQAEDELAAAQAEISKLKDAFLRAKAEQDNVRRRAEKDIANSRKFAVEGFAKEMLSVYDSLKLATAVEVAEDADETVKGVRDGVEITLKQVNSAFAKFALKEIVPAVGDKLDPNLHQAMSMVESADVESGCVVTVIQAGFELHERLLRPAMVVVAK